MDLKELKTKLLNNEKIKLPLRFINLDESNFLIKEYILKIKDILKLEIKEVNSINEIKVIEDDVFSTNNFLFIIKEDKNKLVDDDSIVDSKVIILNSEDPKKDSKIEKVIFNKPLEWQIEDLLKTLIPGLDNAEIQWLCKIAKYDVNRLYNEAEKLMIFNKKDQEVIFNLINKENGYCDLNDLSIFNLSNSILKKDIRGVYSVIRDIDNIDIEGTGLVTILLNNILKIINIQLNSKATPSSLGMSEKQFRAIQYSTFKYSDKKLIDVFEFLTSIDYNLKSGLLEMSNTELVYYVISHILN